ncbi:MAG: nitronate monooxygenase [Peptostreptococcaceae bacterium]|nr:nitronate monooxygenase [Peptostreptococcaceae bacterium]
MINELLGTKYPLIQGAMAWISHSSLVSAVSNAGALGVLAGGNLTKEMAQEQIRKIKQKTDKPFALNIMLLNPHADALADLVLEENIKIVITGAGNPGKYIEKWRSAGVTVIPVVPSVALARRMERLGADAVIAEGTEAGGHVGELTTMSLVPQVVDAVDIPVIAAGGIADHRGFRAALALGAQGVQCGTAFLVAEECDIAQGYKDKIIKAGDTDSVVTGRITGHPVRILKNKLARKLKEVEMSDLSNEAKLAEIEALATGSYRKAVTGEDLDYGSIMGGQSAGLIKHASTADEIIRKIVGA